MEPGRRRGLFRAIIRSMNTVRLRLCLLVGLVAACSLGVAPERPQADDLRVALEKRFAAPAFAIVRDAERVEALPVEETGMGLSATHRVVERPVLLNPATARDMRKTVLSTKSYVGGPMACGFQPGLAIRFHKGRDSVQVLVCFLCRELVFEKPGGEWLDGKLTFSKTVQARLLAVGKKAFPALPWPLARLGEPSNGPTVPPLPLARRGSSEGR